MEMWLSKLVLALVEVAPSGVKAGSVVATGPMDGTGNDAKSKLHSSTPLSNCPW